MDVMSVTRRKPADSKAELREAQRLYLRQVLDLDPQRRTLSEIARAGGLNHTTLTRFYNNPAHKGVLDALTLRRVAEVTGVEPAADMGGLGMTPLQRDAEPFDLSGRDGFSEIVRRLLEARQGAEAMILHTSAVELAGWLPNDLVIVDPRAHPRNGDLVRAEVSDRRGNSENVWRIFDAPYLVSASTNAAFRKPLVVDGQMVRIRGVVIHSLRDRAA